MLIAISSYCQKNYPQKLVLGKDTVVCVTQDQVKTINYVFDERDFYKSQWDSLLVVDEIKDLLLNDYFSINKEISSDNMRLISELNNLKQKDQINNEIQDYLNQEVVNQKSKGLKLAIGGFTFGVTTGTILLLILNK